MASSFRNVALPPTGFGENTIMPEMTLNDMIFKMYTQPHYRRNMHYIFQNFLRKVLTKFEPIKTKFMAEFITTNRDSFRQIREAVEYMNTIFGIFLAPLPAGSKRTEITTADVADFIHNYYEAKIYPLLTLLWKYFSKDMYAYTKPKADMDKFYALILYETYAQYNAEMDALETKGGKRTRRHRRRALKSRRRNRK